MKNKGFWSVIVLLFVCWLGNILYFQSQLLKEPIILNARIEIPAEEQALFSIYYLSNKHEVVEMQALTLENYSISALHPFYTENPKDQSFHQEFTHHLIKEVSFDVTSEDIHQLNGSVEAKKLFAHFSNGQVVPIKLDLLNFPTIAKSEDSSSSYSVEDGRSSSKFFFEKPVTMDPLELSPLTKNFMTVKALTWKEDNQNKNNNPKLLDLSQPQHIKEGNVASIELDSTGEIQERYIRSFQLWQGINEAGNPVILYIPWRIEPHITQDMVNEWVKKARDTE